MTMSSGIKVPATAWSRAERTVIICRYSGKVMPMLANWALMVGFSRPPRTPTRIGVPTAPKVTGVLWIIMPIMTAAMAGKPRATSRGAAMAAGVPKPEAPSMKEPKSQAMMTTWTRRSLLMLAKPRRIAVIAPEYFNVLSSRIAPKTMKRISKVIASPWMVEAATLATGTCQKKRAIPAATR